MKNTDSRSVLALQKHHALTRILTKTNEQIQFFYSQFVKSRTEYCGHNVTNSTDTADAKSKLKVNQGDKDYWYNELRSLGIEPKRCNDLNDKEELGSLADNNIQTMYQDYKTAYSSSNDNEIVDERIFDLPYLAVFY